MRPAAPVMVTGTRLSCRWAALRIRLQRRSVHRAVDPAGRGAPRHAWCQPDEAQRAGGGGEHRRDDECAPHGVGDLFGPARGRQPGGGRDDGDGAQAGRSGDGVVHPAPRAVQPPDSTSPPDSLRRSTTVTVGSSARAAGHGTATPAATDERTGKRRSFQTPFHSSARVREPSRRLLLPQSSRSPTASIACWTARGFHQPAPDRRWPLDPELVRLLRPRVLVSGPWRRSGGPPCLTGYEGQPLRRGHGAPVRVVAPGRRGPWWIKWVTSVQLDDRPWWLQTPFPFE